MPGYSADKKERKKKKKKRLHWLLKNVGHSHFVQTDGHANLQFMWQINIFSRFLQFHTLEATLENVHTEIQAVLAKALQSKSKATKCEILTLPTCKPAKH